MKRPGPVGISLLLAFAIVAAIELRTLLGMFGLDLTASVYYGIASVLIALVLLALLALPDEETKTASV